MGCMPSMLMRYLGATGCAWKATTWTWPTSTQSFRSCFETPHGLPAGERYLEGLRGQAQDLNLFGLLAWSVGLRGYLFADTDSSGDPGMADRKSTRLNS